MANVAFRAVGTAANTTGTTLPLVAPTLSGNDIMFALISCKDNVSVTPLEGWTTIYDTTNTTAQQTYLAWKRASDTDSGATFTFTVGITTISLGAIVAYSGCILAARPYGSSSINSTGVAEDNVNYSSITPRGVGVVVAFGAYADDNADADTFSAGNPTFTERLDAAATDISIYIHDGANTTAATGARTLATASTTDAISQGIVLDLLPQPDGGAGMSEAGVTYARRVRVGTRGG
jgi:hypothetical protein